jgi:hypothetical protein
MKTYPPTASAVDLAVRARFAFDTGRTTALEYEAALTELGFYNIEFETAYAVYDGHRYFVGASPARLGL